MRRRISGEAVSLKRYIFFIVRVHSMNDMGRGSMTTMNKELDILNYIGNNADTTQREISEHLGISLGTINILLRAMVRKGFVKIERLQPNSVKYFLTPAGIANKVERTYGYIVRTYRELVHQRSQIAVFAERMQVSHPDNRLCFFGSEDELFLMIQDLLNAGQLPKQSVLCTSIGDLQRNSTDHESLVITWSEKASKVCAQHGYQCVNLLSHMAVTTRKDAEE